MAQLRARWLRLPALGGLLGITGLIGLRRLARRGSRQRPTGDELMRMTDAEFATFVRLSDVQTVDGRPEFIDFRFFAERR